MAIVLLAAADLQVVDDLLEDVEFPDLLANYVMIAIGCAIRVVIQDQNLLQGK